MLSEVLHLVFGKTELGGLDLGEAPECSKDFGVPWTWVLASILPLTSFVVVSRPHFPPLLNGHRHSTCPTGSCEGRRT